MPDTFTCPRCGAVSHNQTDVAERYCGQCQAFVDDMTAAEERIYVDIIDGRQKPEPVAYQAGKHAHAAGKQFHEGPKPFFRVESISWRMGWNDRALDATSPPTPDPL